ncbi:MAG: DNA alkylation repair protein [Bacteroidota bacterium]|nr:DNA alkylation repair protein [Bacteroidota bacterium]
MKNHNQIISQVIDDLKAKARPDYKKFAERMIPSSLEILGVSTPDMRKVIKHWFIEFKELSYNEYLALMLDFKATRIFECIQISHELIAKNKMFREKLSEQDIDKLLIGLDNWATVDAFSMYISGPAWINNQISNTQIMNWSESDNVWLRRLAIVSCVFLNQKSKSEDWKRDITINLCKLHFLDKEAIIHKAISWALRSLVKNHPEAVQDFINENSETIKPYVRREVQNKINTGRKN